MDHLVHLVEHLGARSDVRKRPSLPCLLVRVRQNWLQCATHMAILPRLITIHNSDLENPIASEVSRTVCRLLNGASSKAALHDRHRLALVIVTTTSVGVLASLRRRHRRDTSFLLTLDHFLGFVSRHHRTRHGVGFACRNCKQSEYLIVGLLFRRHPSGHIALQCARCLHRGEQ